MHSERSATVPQARASTSLDNSSKVSSSAAPPKTDVAPLKPEAEPRTPPEPGDAKLKIVEKVPYPWENEEWGEEGSLCGGACAVRDEGRERDVVPMLCGKWGCRVCGRLRYRWFRRNVTRCVEEHKLAYFWTLTISHDDVSAAESWDLIMTAWNRFRTNLKEAFPDLQYIWVIEPQKSGHAHLHVLWNKWVDQKLVSKMWKRATRGSYIVYVQPVTSADIGGYLAKYVSKLSGRIIEVPGMGALYYRHRYGTSRGIHFTPFRQKSEGWYLVASAYKDYYRWAKRMGKLRSEARGWVPSMRIELHPVFDWEVPVEGVDVQLVEGQRRE